MAIHQFFKYSSSPEPDERTLNGRDEGLPMHLGALAEVFRTENATWASPSKQVTNIFSDLDADGPDQEQQDAQKWITDLALLKNNPFLVPSEDPVTRFLRKLLR